MNFLLSLCLSSLYSLVTKVRGLSDLSEKAKVSEKTEPSSKRSRGSANSSERPSSSHGRQTALKVRKLTLNLICHRCLYFVRDIESLFSQILWAEGIPANAVLGLLDGLWFFIKLENLPFVCHCLKGVCVVALFSTGHTVYHSQWCSFTSSMSLSLVHSDVLTLSQLLAVNQCRARDLCSHVCE